MASVAHPVPSRMAQNVAALYGHDDDTLIAWQRFCVQAAEALRAQHDPERLTKALRLAQDGAVTLEDDGSATVASGDERYPVTAAGTCDCPDTTYRGAPCKHLLAVRIHAQAQALLAPSASAAPPQAPAAPAAKPARQPKPTAPPAPQAAPVSPPDAARWHVQEAPASCCVRVRVGELEIMYTMRDTTDAELTGRVQYLVPWVQDLLDQARERQAQLAALHQQRAAAKVAPDAPAQPPVPTPPPASAPADLQALLQQAVQQALAAAAATGQAQGTPPPAAPSGAVPDDQQTGVCSLHQAAMTRHTDPDSGDTWYSHYLEDEQRYCKGVRPTRRNGKSRR
jgi:hypothetical protein